jgi:site-specific DNA recombinase
MAATELAVPRSQRDDVRTALVEKYDDGGHTGANVDRPVLKKVLQDARDGLVDCVLVYKVDRLTRSLLDSLPIIEVLDQHGVSFVSVTQQFNTTSSLGRLTLNILLSFAQFEREMISERTRDKMGAARRKGKWVGGNLVLGYDVTPQGGALAVNEEEAARVREIFRLYLEYGSLIPVVQELDRRGWKMKSWITREGRAAGGSPITKNKLHNMLTNMVYVGKVRYRGEVYAGEHPAIIEEGTWNQVQDTLNRNGRRGGRNVRNKYSALLKGIVRCASCDAGMIHTYVQKKNVLYRYYVCVKAHQRGWNKCPTKSVSAPTLESAVVQQIRAICRNPMMLCEVTRQLAADHESRQSVLVKEQAAMEGEMAKLAGEIRGLASLVNAPGAASRSATDRLADLHERAARLEGDLAQVRRQIRDIDNERVDADDLQQALERFDPLWEHMSSWEQEQFVHTLVDQIRYDGTTGTVTVAFRSSGIRSLCQNEPEQRS